MLNVRASRNSIHILIMGDFNLPGINWDLQVSENSDLEQRFLDCFNDFFLHQHSTKPTHYRAQQTANVLDLVFTNEENMIDGITYSETVGKSYHLVMEWNIACYNTPSATRVVKYHFDKWTSNFNNV